MEKAHLRAPTAHPARSPMRLARQSAQVCCCHCRRLHVGCRCHCPIHGCIFPRPPVCLAAGCKEVLYRLHGSQANCLNLTYCDPVSLYPFSVIPFTPEAATTTVCNFPDPADQCDAPEFCRIGTAQCSDVPLRHSMVVTNACPESALSPTSRIARFPSCWDQFHLKPTTRAGALRFSSDPHRLDVRVDASASCDSHKVPPRYKYYFLLCTQVCCLVRCCQSRLGLSPAQSLKVHAHLICMSHAPSRYVCIENQNTPTRLAIAAADGQRGVRRGHAVVPQLGRPLD